VEPPLAATEAEHVVGALDRLRTTDALTPTGRLFIDGGDPTRELLLER